jgi:hypothetical protein
MLDGIDLEEFSKLRFAGDFYLWKHFAKKEELYIVSAYLGGFRFHSKNKSRDISKYIDEFKIISDRCPILDLDLIRIPLYHLAWWFLPGTLKNMLNRKIIWCNHSDGSWHLGNGLVNAILLYLRKTE